MKLNRRELLGYGASALSVTALGMPLVFSDQADLSGIAPARLRLSDVLHKAFVEVNEKGTEAAAATAGVMMTVSAPPPRVVFRADRPFVLVIRDNATGSLLFAGRVVDPRAR